MVTINKLKKDNLYILSILALSKYKSYSNVIKYITILVNKLNGKQGVKCIATHTSLLLNYNNKWIICEVSFNGKIHSILSYDKNTKYYITDLGEISTSIKDNIFTEYHKIDVKGIMRIIVTPFNYPVLKAMASIELPETNILFIMANKIIDLLSDIGSMIRRFIGIEVEFCTEAVVKTLYKNNIVIPDQLQKIVFNSNFKFNEIYPQNVLETTNYEELIDN